MTLVPVDGVLATVMKVADIDEGAAATLVRFGLFESLADQIDENRPWLEADAVALMEDRVAKARSVMLRQHVGKALSGEPEPDDLAYAEALAIMDEFVHKSLSGRLLSFFNQTHPRDEKGRFIAANVSQGNRSEDSAHGPDTRRLQTETEAAEHINRWKQNGLVKDETPVDLHFVSVDPVDGRPLSKEETVLPSSAASAAADAKRYAEAENGKLRLVGVSVSRSDVPKFNDKQRAALDAMATLSGGNAGVMQLGNRVARQVTRDDLNWSGAGQKWNDQSKPGDRQAYRRMKLTGQALSSVSAPGTPGATIGGLAQLVGDLGPEAEKVIGPGIRRTAYRYRGTERKPDKAIFDQVQYANSSFNAVDTKNDERRAAAVRMIRDQAIREKENPGTQITSHYLGKPGSRDQHELRASGDIVAAHLMENLPEERYAALSLASGEIPPSEGVLIDGNGNVVSQSIGFKGDHYLPFDLKNLGRLQGGQYVRTRLSGGPTTEDIYTGLMTGARQVDVVSHSGVFTVEFDPTFRGGRRYSDKARKMIRRYEELVDTLADQKVVQEDISPAEQARIRRKAYEAANWDETQGQKNFQSEMNRRRAQASVGVNDEEIEAEARERAQSSPEWQRASPSQQGELLRDQMGIVRQEAGEAAYRMYRLDGPGYYGALRALKQEFPYYIRDVDWKPLPQWRQERNLPRGDFPIYGKPDRGHVRRGQLHAFDREGDQGTMQPRTAGQTEQGARGTNGAQAPAAAAGPAVSVADVVKSKKYVRSLAEGVRAGIGWIGGAYVNEPDIPSNYERDDARKAGAMAYIKWQWGKHNEDPEKFAEWLATTADDDDLERMESALPQFEELADGLGLAGVTPERVADGRKKMEALLHVARPFAPGADDMVMAEPSMKNPKPQPFPDIVALNTQEKVDQFLQNQVQYNEPAVLSALGDVTNSPGDIPDDIHTLIEQHGKETDPAKKEAIKSGLSAMQRAWTLFTVSQTVATLKSMGLEVEEEGPKAPSPGPSQPGEAGTARKSLSRSASPGRLKPLRPAQSPATRAVVEKFLASLGR